MAFQTLVLCPSEEQEVSNYTAVLFVLHDAGYDLLQDWVKNYSSQ